MYIYLSDKRDIFPIKNKLISPEFHKRIDSAHHYVDTPL